MRGDPERTVVIFLLIILIPIPSLVDLSLILGLKDISEVVRWKALSDLQVALYRYQLDCWNACRVRFHLDWLLVCVFG